MSIFALLCETSAEHHKCVHIRCELTIFATCLLLNCGCADLTPARDLLRFVFGIFSYWQRAVWLRFFHLKEFSLDYLYWLWCIGGPFLSIPREQAVVDARIFPLLRDLSRLFVNAVRQLARCVRGNIQNRSGYSLIFTLVDREGVVVDYHAYQIYLITFLSVCWMWPMVGGLERSTQSNWLVITQFS